MYFDHQFCQFHRLRSGAGWDDESEEDSSEPHVELVSHDFERTCSQLRELKWIHVSEQMYSEMLFSRVGERILKVCKGNFEEPLLEQINKWINDVVFPWLNILLSPSEAGVAHQSDIFTPAKRGRGRARAGKTNSRISPNKQQDTSAFLQWKSRLQFFAYERFAELRISEMFDIIVDFPDSMEAINNLKECLEHTRQHKTLIRDLQSAFGKRLLHPGANTSDIITQYISAIRSLRILDPSGVTLEAIGGDIQMYLKERPDAVRCIVRSLTGASDAGGELLEELEACPDSQALEGDDSDHGDQAEGGDGMDWEPDPLEADPTKTSRSRRTADIIAILVGMFGNKELFVHEYKSLLGDKLLCKSSYDTDQEVIIYLRCMNVDLSTNDARFKRFPHQPENCRSLMWNF